MNYHFFIIPISDDEEAAEDLNRFLGAHRIVSVERQFVSDGPNSAWAFCICTEDAKTRPAKAGKRATVDYRDVLSPEDFEVFARLRNLRKVLAERDGVPPYAVFNNEQLAEIVRKRSASVATLKSIEGVGESKIKNYAPAFSDALRKISMNGGGDPGHET